MTSGRFNVLRAVASCCFTRWRNASNFQRSTLSTSLTARARAYEIVKVGSPQAPASVAARASAPDPTNMRKTGGGLDVRADAGRERVPVAVARGTEGK